MAMKRIQPQSTVRNALEFIKENVGQPLTVDQVARHAGVATPTLKALFAKTTGKGVFAQILWLRIEKAKELLKETDLEITHVAFEVGFGSHEQFSRMFKKRVGVSPSHFRNRLAKEGKVLEDVPVPDVRIKESSPAQNLQKDWDILSGTWSASDFYLEGKSDTDLILAYRHNLPANFSIQLEVQALPGKGLVPANLSFGLRDEQRANLYAEIVIGCQDNRRGELRYLGEQMCINSKTVVVPSAWHRIRMDLSDDTLFFFLDGEQAFSFRDPFPPAYARRCAFTLAGWRSMIRLRGFAVHNTGQAQFVSVIRQGDALFNAGLFQNAREFYERQLNERPPFSLAQELSYKIGRCDLEQNMFLEAGKRLEPIAKLPEMDFWAQQARLALLDLEGRLDRTAEFCRMAGDFFASPFLVNGVRFQTKKLTRGYEQRGFHDRSVLLLSVLRDQEPAGSLGQLEAVFQMSTAFILSGRLAEARPLLETVIKSPGASDDQQLQSLHDLSYLCSVEGDFEESERLLGEIRRRTESVFRLAQCDLFHGFNLRGQKGPHKALEWLEKVVAQYGAQRPESIVAQIEMMMILCSMGRTTEALAMLDQARANGPNHSYVLRRSFRYVIPLCQGDYAQAADILWANGTDESAWPCTWAGNVIKAGILFELADNKAKASEIWQWVPQRFPESRIRYYGNLAKDLSFGQGADFESMPYLRDDRSEMFYLAGLLFEKRGQPARAEHLFRLSVQEDATHRWPVHLSQKNLRSAKRQ